MSQTTSSGGELPSVFFCSICCQPFPYIGVARAHVTSGGGEHEGHTGDDLGAVVDANGDPVETPTPKSSDRPSGSVRGRTDERRAALLGLIEECGGSLHAITHSEQAERFGVAIATINQDLQYLRETGELAETEPTERGPDGEPIFRCGFCGEPYGSVRAVKTHVTKKNDDDHRGHAGSDPGALAD